MPSIVVALFYPTDKPCRYGSDPFQEEQWIQSKLVVLQDVRAFSYYGRFLYGSPYTKGAKTRQELCVVNYFFAGLNCLYNIHE